MRDSLTTDAPFAPNAFLRIDRAGKVTFVMPVIEMGQGTYTSMPMLIAEELEVDVDKVAIEHSPPDDKLYANPLIGMQMTGGSTAIRGTYVPLRRAGATARVMLVTAAAQRWNVDPSTCRAENGVVVHAPTGRKLGYGELVDAAAKLPVPEKVALKEPADFKLIGTPHRRLDTAGKVDGSAKFGIDSRLPGMKFAVVAISPTFGGKLVSVDEAKAKAVPGVTPGRAPRRRRRDRGHSHLGGQARSRCRRSAVGRGTERQALHGRHRCAACRRVGKARRGRAARRRCRRGHCAGRAERSTPFTSSRFWRTRRWSR